MTPHRRTRRFLVTGRRVLPISDSTWDLYRERWQSSIPSQYRLIPARDKGLCSDRYLSAAIILPPPPVSLITAFLLGIFGPQHLTEKQLAAKAARQACGRPGRRKGDCLTSVDRTQTRPSRARQKPSLPPLATIGDIISDRSLMRICEAMGFPEGKG
jgi:hypothetical protein